jgi:peptidyl-dipeptidase Dcp
LNYNETELKQYFEYENVINGMFEIMKWLYGIELKKTWSSKLWENDIEYYEVWRNQKLISYFMIDPFFTKQKRSWAWANNLQEKDEKHIPFVINVYNIKKATSGPTLLSFSEVETIFHEFGHAMHEMLSVSQYPELSWFHVERDFVELPSQFHEHYCRDEESLALFAKHRETGEQIPKRILETLKTLDHVDSGNMVLNQCVYAWLDMYIHSGLQTHDTSELEESILHYINDVSYFKKEETYKMYCSFSHIFDGWYAAWYYSYLWSEVLELDIRKKFQKEGIFSPDTSKDFYEKILSQGSKKKASDLFENFMNRPMSTDWFFKDKGFIV